MTLTEFVPNVFCAYFKIGEHDGTVGMTQMALTSLHFTTLFSAISWKKLETAINISSCAQFRLNRTVAANFPPVAAERPRTMLATDETQKEKGKDPTH